MPALNVSLTVDQLQTRLQDRLRALNPAAPKTILWQEKSNRVLIFVDSLQARLLPGWLLCSLDLQSEETGRQKLQFVFFLGTAGQGDGLHSSVTINAATPQASQLAEVWGANLQRVLWDAILDCLEAFVGQAAAKFPGQPVALHGFEAATDALSAVVIAGDK